MSKIDWQTLFARARAIVDSMNYTAPECMGQRIVALTKLFEAVPDESPNELALRKLRSIHPADISTMGAAHLDQAIALLGGTTGPDETSEEISPETDEETNSEPEEGPEEFWQYGFSCCVAAICASLEHLAETDDDVDQEVLRALIEAGADPTRVRDVHEKIKTCAPIFLGLFVTGKLPLRAAFEQVHGSMKLALEIGIQKAIDMEECDG